jgi:hypothetical protein
MFNQKDLHRKRRMFNPKGLHRRRKGDLLAKQAESIISMA